jgi:hypothetical protein
MLIYISALIAVTCFFYLFVFIDIKAKGILPSMKYTLFKTFPDTLRRIGRTVFGHTFVQAIDDAFYYIGYKSNPIPQLIYVIVHGWTFYIYIEVGFKKYIPGIFLADYHKYLGTFF